MHQGGNQQQENHWKQQEMGRRLVGKPVKFPEVPCMSGQGQVIKTSIEDRGIQPSDRQAGGRILDARRRAFAHRERSAHSQKGGQEGA